MELKEEEKDVPQEQDGILIEEKEELVEDEDNIDNEKII